MRRLVSPGVRGLAVLGLVALGAMAGTSSSSDGAQQFVVTPLLRTELSGDPSREAVIVHGVFAPGASTGRHTHPGDEYAYVIEGTLELLVDGSGSRRVGAGEAYHNSRGVVHETRNIGEGTARIASTFIVDRGVPLLQPAR